MLNRVVWKTDAFDFGRTAVRTTRIPNSDWEERVFNDEAMLEFMRQHFPPYLATAYERLHDGNGPARADIWRYAVLYKYGGVYVDSDSGFEGPMKNFENNAWANNATMRLFNEHLVLDPTHIKGHIPTLFETLQGRWFVNPFAWQVQRAVGGPYSKPKLPPALPANSLGNRFMIVEREHPVLLQTLFNVATVLNDWDDERTRVALPFWARLRYFDDTYMASVHARIVHITGPNMLTVTAWETLNKLGPDDPCTGRPMLFVSDTPNGLAPGLRATERGWKALDTNTSPTHKWGHYTKRHNEFPLLGDAKPASAEHEAEFRKWFAEEWKRVTCKYKKH